MVLTGPAGVGKTRLVREMVGTFEAAGFATAWIIGTRAAAAIPFGAAAPLLPMPASRETVGAATVDTMASIRDAVSRRAQGRSLVLAVDDAHCLDDATAALVHQLATTTDTRLVVTLRIGEPAPDAVDALWKDGIAERLDLQPLSDGEIRSLLTEALGGPIEERSAWELTRRCAGNCMFLLELVRSAQREDRFRLEQGRWRLRGELAPSGRLVELVDGLTRSLPSPSQELLELLALGEPLPLGVVERIVDHATLEDVSRLRLVDVAPDPRRCTVRLSHPLYGEVIRWGMPTLRSRARCRSLVAAFRSTPLRRSDDVVRFASWSLDAGEPADADLLLRAAHRAVEGADLRTAERFAAAAVDQLSPVAVAGQPLHPVTPRPEQPRGEAEMIELRTRALLVHADALGRLRRFDDARQMLDRVDPLASERQVAEVIESRAIGDFLSVDTPGAPLAGRRAERGQAGKVTAALATLEDAEHGFRDPTAVIRLRLTRALLLYGSARPIDALEVLGATATPTGELEHRWLNVQGMSLITMGRLDEAGGAVARAVSLPADDVVAPALGWVPTAMAENAAGRGDLSSLEAMATSFLDHARSLRHPAIQRSAAAFLGWSLLNQGRITEAIELLIVGTDASAGLDSQGTLPLAFGALASAYALAGDPRAAQQALDQADREVCTPNRLSDAQLVIGQALTARAQGVPGFGREVLRTGLMRCHEAGLHLFEVGLAGAACQIGAADLALELTPDLVTMVDGPMPQAVHDWATAAVADDAPRLDAVGATFEASGFLLTAAEIAGAAADSHERAGQARSAMGSRARARRLLDRCPGADDAFLRRSRKTAILTARELEIARHAAMGLSSAAIAERLFVSSRTVDSHLGRVFLKLDVKRRGELEGHPLLG